MTVTSDLLMLKYEANRIFYWSINKSERTVIFYSSNALKLQQNWIFYNETSSNVLLRNISWRNWHFFLTLRALIIETRRCWFSCESSTSSKSQTRWNSTQFSYFLFYFSSWERLRVRNSVSFWEELSKGFLSAINLLKLIDFLFWIPSRSLALLESVSRRPWKRQLGRFKWWKQWELNYHFKSLKAICKHFSASFRQFSLTRILRVFIT